MVSYTFADGPFRDLAIRFGYDPRDHPEARLCVSRASYPFSAGEC